LKSEEIEMKNIAPQDRSAPLCALEKNDKIKIKIKINK
jgi:hypothetical protein